MVSPAQKTESPYYTNSRDDLTQMIPAAVRCMLDVGCGAGEFGKRMQSKLNAEVWGVEYVPDVAEIARKSLFKVFAGDAAVILPTLPEGYFDLITFNDVLEHMVDPESVLSSARRLLSPDGVVLVSLPNLRHWNEFRRLLWNGEFEYADKGILDRTHLRFFTAKSIPGFFRRAGYHITRMRGLNPTPSRSLKVVNFLTANKFRDCRFLQFAMIAKPLENL